MSVVGLGLGITASANFEVAVEAEVIRKKVGVSAVNQAQVDTAQSKFGGSSLAIDGTADYLKIASSDTFNFGTDNFTVEFWVRPTSIPNDRYVIGSSTGSFGSGSLGLGTKGSGTAVLRFYVNDSGGDIVEDSTAMSLNTWYHYALVRSGTTFTLYRDGTSVDTGTYAGSINFSNTGGLIIGQAAWVLTGSYGLPGHIDELRISNTARYTAGFTPSTTPFVNDDNTLLLLHMNGTDGSTFFEDDNGVREPISLNVVGNTQIDTARSKFGGASALFDGTGDGLNVSANTNSPFYLIEGSWTIECFFNVDNDTGSSTVGLVIVGSHPSLPNYGGGILWRNFDLKLQASWDAYNGSDPKQDLITSAGSALALDTWHHAAMVYDADASTWSVYQNGTRIANETVTYSGVKLGDNGAFWIGSGVSSFNAGGNGWIDEVRVSNTARYTGASFTPPTAQFTNDEDTICLFHMNGTDASTDFRDDNGDTAGRSAVGVSASADAQIDTAESKFGGASALFDGTGDYLGIYGATMSYSDDFTIEGWINLDVLPSAGTFRMIYAGNSNTEYASIANQGGTYVSNLVIRNSGGTLYETYYTIPSISTGTWYHWAIVKNGATIKHFFDGTELTTLYSSSGTMGADFGFDGIDYIARWNGNTSHMFDGYLDEMRVSDTARYTASFTPDTTPFQNDANTLLLLHMDGTDGSTVFIDDNGKHPPA